MKNQAEAKSRKRMKRFVRSHHRSVDSMVAEKRMTPPMVGVPPFLCSCASSISARWVSRIPILYRARINGRPAKSVKAKEVMMAKMARLLM